MPSRKLLPLILMSMFIPAGLCQTDGAIPPDLAALQQQNALLQEKIKQLQLQLQLDTLNNPDEVAKQNTGLEQQLKLIQQQQQLDKLNNPDQLAQQNSVLEQRIKMLSQEQALLKLAVPQLPKGFEGTLERKGDTPIQSNRVAYLALSGVGEAVAKALDCSGKNLVIYGATHSESLLSLRTFIEQTQLLKDRMEQVRKQSDLLPDPDKPPAKESSVFGVAALAGPVLQTVLDLISLFRKDTTITSSEVTTDDVAIVAAIAGSPSGRGCHVYWPDQYAANPFSPTSAVSLRLRDLAAVNDSPDADQAHEGLQQRLARLKALARSAAIVIQDLAEQIDEAKGKLTAANSKVDRLTAQVDSLTKAIKDEKDPDEKSRLKQRRAKADGDLSKAATEAQQIAASVPEDIVKITKKKRNIERYVNLITDLTTATAAASDAYNAFRGTLLDAASGSSALSRMLRAQALRDLLFDDKGVAVPGASVVQTKVEKLSGAVRVQKSIWSSAKEDYSGGVVLSFVQYEPNGLMLRRAVAGCHSGFGPVPAAISCGDISVTTVAGGTPPAESK